jgi:hypothetical protein
MSTFKKPGAPPPSDRLSDHLDEPVLLRPKRYEHDFETSMGRSTVLWTEALILKPEAPGEFFNLGEVPIFWSGVQVQLDGSIDEWVLGRLHQGTANNPKQYILEEGRAEDEKLAEAALFPGTGVMGTVVAGEEAS